MFLDNLLCRTGAFATLIGNALLLVNILHRAGALINIVFDLAVCDAVTNANVHKNSTPLGTHPEVPLGLKMASSLSIT